MWAEPETRLELNAELGPTSTLELRRAPGRGCSSNAPLRNINQWDLQLLHQRHVRPGADKLKCTSIHTKQETAQPEKFLRLLSSRTCRSDKGVTVNNGLSSGSMRCPVFFGGPVVRAVVYAALTCMARLWLRAFGGDLADAGRAKQDMFRCSIKAREFAPAGMGIAQTFWRKGEQNLHAIRIGDIC